MNSKKRSVTLGALILSAIFVIGGCPPANQNVRTISVRSEPVCVRDSELFGFEITFPCTEKNRARDACLVCDFMGESAKTLVKVNRSIGPTTPNRLYNEAIQVIRPTLKIIYETVGPDVAKAYLIYIQEMSNEIAQRNVTDLVAYPRKEFRRCMKTYDFNVN